MEKELTLQDVFDSKIFVKGNREYKTPKEYLEPFVEKIKDIAPDIRVQVSGMVQNAEIDKSINTAYSRILIEANKEGLQGIVYPTFGAVIALDPNVPIYKFYEGLTVRACTNLSVFSSGSLYEGKVFDGLTEGYSMLDKWIEEWENTFGKNLDIAKNLQEKDISKKELEPLLGKLLKYGVENRYFGTNPVIGAARELYNPNSAYYVGEETTAWNVYNAVTAYLSTKTDIADKASKTLLLSKFFIN